MPVTVTDSGGAEHRHASGSVPLVDPGGVLVVAEHDSGRTVAVYPAHGWRSAVADDERVELYVPVAARVAWDGTKLRALYLRPHDGKFGSEQYPDGKGRPLTIEDVRAEHDEGDAPGEVEHEDGHRCSTLHVEATTPPPSDGYLADAESWGTREQQVQYARNAGHGVLPTREVVALERLNRVLGNERSLSEVGTGRARGLVLDSLREWHSRQAAITRSLGMGPGDPEAGPYEVPVADLAEQVQRLGAYIVEHVPGEPSRSEGAIDCAIRLLDEYRVHLERQGAPARPSTMIGEARVRVERDETEPLPVSEEPRRPRLDYFPADALLLTYPELRRLLALHLEQCHADEAARAMREGETPLRLSEVLGS